MSPEARDLPEPSGDEGPSIDDTAAFQRFYFGEEPKTKQSLFHRIFVGWWRDRS